MYIDSLVNGERLAALTYRQSICQTDIRSQQKAGSWLTSQQKRYLDQFNDWFVCVFLATHTCIVWPHTLFCICRSIGRHFKRSVDTLIVHTLSVLKDIRKKCPWFTPYAPLGASLRECFSHQLGNYISFYLLCKKNRRKWSFYKSMYCER